MPTSLSILSNHREWRPRTPVVYRGVASFTQKRTCVLEIFVGFFQDFLLQVKAICSVADLTLYCADVFRSVLLLSRIVFARKIQQAGGTREIHLNRFVATKNRPRLIIIPFKIYLESFPIQKLFIFFSFLTIYKCRNRKSIIDHFNVPQN